VQDLYATRLRIVGPGLGEIVDAVTAWAAKGRAASLAPIDLKARGRTEEDLGRRRTLLRETFGAPDSSASGFRLVLRHPDNDDPVGLQWVATVDASQVDDADVSLSMRLTREALVHRVAPARLDLRPPALIARLLRDYECRDGVTVMSAEGIRLPATEVSAFLERQVRDTDRSMPVVILATPLVEPAFKAEMLAGLCHVAYVGRLGWERLRYEMPEIAPEWRGARIVWPLPWRSGLRHPSFRPDETQPVAAFVDRVMRLVARLSVGRTPVDPVLLRLRDERLKDLAAAATTPADQSEEAALWREFAEELDVTLTSAQRENEALVADMRALNEKIDDLEAQLMAQGQELAFYREQGAPSELQQEIASLEPLDVPIATWRDVAENMHLIESDAFCLSGDVRASLVDNPYPDPQRMWGFLVRLASIAEDYRAAGGQLGMQLKAYGLESYGIEIAQTDRSLGKFEVTYDGERLNAVPHVKVDDNKKANECGRIHFAIEKAKCRFVLAHVGLHL
jgi:hypothetical protein